MTVSSSSSTYQPLPVWAQLASLCFTLAGVHSDLMVIRFFLFSAYLFLFVNAILKMPPAPWDSITWSVIGLYVQGASLVCLFLDERPVHLHNDHDALWRLSYRTAGLSRRLFQEIIAPHVQLVQFLAGEDIPTKHFFYIIYQGQVHLEVYDEQNQFKIRRTLQSAEMFDLSHLDLFSEKTNVFYTNRIRCTCQSPTAKVFRIRHDDLKCIAHHRFAKTVWQSLLINNLSIVVENYMQQQQQHQRGRDCRPRSDHDHRGSNCQHRHHQKQPSPKRENSNSSIRQVDEFASDIGYSMEGNSESSTFDAGDDYDISSIDWSPANIVDPIFSPLQDWEQPPPVRAGSGKALFYPVHHLLSSMRTTFSLPWPFMRHPTGIRQTQLRAPTPPATKPELEVIPQHEQNRSLQQQQPHQQQEQPLEMLTRPRPRLHYGNPLAPSSSRLRKWSFRSRRSRSFSPQTERNRAWSFRAGRSRSRISEREIPDEGIDIQMEPDEDAVVSAASSPKLTIAVPAAHDGHSQEPKHWNDIARLEI